MLVSGDCKISLDFPNTFLSNTFAMLQNPTYIFRCAEFQTQGCWLRSVNGTSALCPQPLSTRQIQIDVCTTCNIEKYRLKNNLDDMKVLIILPV